MTLHEKIITIYPELTLDDFFKLVVLQDDSDGLGAYIKQWNYSKPQPTQEQLDAIE